MTAAAMAVQLSTISGVASAVVAMPSINNLPNPVVAPCTVAAASLRLGCSWRDSSIGVAPPPSRFPALRTPLLKALLRHSANAPPMSLDRFALFAVQLHCVLTIVSLGVREQRIQVRELIFVDILNFGRWGRW